MIKKEIADKLFKAELSEHKVEFALIEDIEKAVRLATQARDEMKRSMVQHNGLLRAAAVIKKSFDKIESQAKEIGIPVPQELRRFLEMADEFERQGQAISKAYDTL